MELRDQVLRRRRCSRTVRDSIPPPAQPHGRVAAAAQQFIETSVWRRAPPRACSRGRWATRGPRLRCPHVAGVIKTRVDDQCTVENGFIGDVDRRADPPSFHDFPRPRIDSPAPASLNHPTPRASCARSTRRARQTSYAPTRRRARAPHPPRARRRASPRACTDNPPAAAAGYEASPAQKSALVPSRSHPIAGNAGTNAISLDSTRRSRATPTATRRRSSRSPRPGRASPASSRRSSRR